MTVASGSSRHPTPASTSSSSKVAMVSTATRGLPSPASPPRSAASSSASTAVPMSASSSTPPRSFSDPFSSQNVVAVTSLGLQPSPDVQLKYGVDGPRRASWTGTARSSPAIDATKVSYDDPLHVSARRVGGADTKIQYGPGFYIPPPGYQASSMEVKGGVRAYGAGQAAAFNEMHGFGTNITSRDGRVNGNPISGRATGSELPSDQARMKRRRLATAMGDATGSSSRGSLIIWAVLGALIATTQMSLLRLYDSESKALCTSMSLGGLFLELYGAFVAIVGLLIAPTRQSQEQNRSVTAPRHARNSDMRKSLLTSLMNCMPTICGIVVCLGAVSQMAALVIYASQSLNRSVAYITTVALAIALATTFVTVALALHRNGHFCCRRRSRPNRNNNKRPSKGQKKEPTLPISDRRPRSPCSPASSHSGKYVPDYGLDSSTDSNDDDDPRTNQPRADWMDEALKDVIRSPLLDMPKCRR